MVLRIRKRPGMEREDVLAAPRTADRAGGSVWGKLLGSGTKPTPAVGACVLSSRKLRILPRRVVSGPRLGQGPGPGPELSWLRAC